MTKLLTMIKSLTREVFREYPQVRKMLWGGGFWTDWCLASTVGKHGDQKKIGSYVQS